MNVKFGNYGISARRTGDRSYLYDRIRKRWIIATPEEQVRQVWLHFLIEDLKISQSKIAVERGFKINEKIKRFDICIYDQHALPEILIECKSSTTQFHRWSLEQLSHYNIYLKCRAFILTNGLRHYGIQFQGGEMKEIVDIRNLFP